jgi:hypothetical protein
LVALNCADWKMASEGGQGQDAAEKCGHYRRRAPPMAGGVDDPRRQAHQPGRDEDGPDDVDASGGRRVRRLGNVSGRHHHHQRGDGEIDQKDQTPGKSTDEKATEERTHGRGHAAQSRPGSDGPALVVGSEGGAQDSQ